MNAVKRLLSFGPVRLNFGLNLDLNLGQNLGQNLGLILVLVFGLTLALAGALSPAHAQSESAGHYQLPEYTKAPYTGDLDGMVERRVIRVLVTYSNTHYFVDKGAQKGLTYEAMKAFEEHLNKKLKSKHLKVHLVFIPVARDEIIPYLTQGRGDIAAANLSITDKRRRQVDFTDPTWTNISEIVVTGPDSPPVKSVEDLSGLTVYVRKSSSHYDSLKALNSKLRGKGLEQVDIQIAPDELESEDILEMVNAGLVDATVADSHIAEFWSKVFPNITLHPEAALASGESIGMMVRKSSPELKAELNEFLALHPEGSKDRNALFRKYLQQTRYVLDATSKAEMKKFNSLVSLFKKYGDKYRIDHLLMMAQGYQESRLNQEARSPAGAIGVMQLLPSTGKDMNVGDITQVDPNIHAGVKYNRFIMDRFYGSEPLDDLNKGLFSFAAYNAGAGRIAQFRKEAAKRGLNPDVWFNNVELIAAEKIGRETVRYVSNIYKYYLAYKLIRERSERRAAIKGKLGAPAKKTQ